MQPSWRRAVRAGGGATFAVASQLTPTPDTSAIPPGTPGKSSAPPDGTDPGTLPTAPTPAGIDPSTAPDQSTARPDGTQTG